MAGKGRVLHVITRLDTGGSATNTIVSSCGIRRFGWDTELLYGRTFDPAGQIANRLSKLEIKTFYTPSLVRAVSPLKDVYAFLRVLRIIKRGQYDMIHTHSSKAGALGRMAANLLDIPVIHTPHGHIFYGYYGEKVTSGFIMAERWLARRTRKIISLTDIETRESLERGIGTEDMYCTIPSGVRIDDFRNIPMQWGEALRREHCIPETATLFLSVGRLVEIKGFDILLRSFAGAPDDVYLMIVGDGHMLVDLRNLAKALRLSPRVRFLGEMVDIRPALAAADAFVLASRNEGMGRVFIEAMAAGLPVIGSKTGGIPALINSENGFLVQVCDSQGFAEAISILSESNTLRATMGTAAAESVYPEYDEEQMIQRLDRLYQETLNVTSG